MIESGLSAHNVSKLVSDPIGWVKPKPMVTPNKKIKAFKTNS